MSITKKEEQTISFYDQQAEKWIGALGNKDLPSFWESELKEFNSFLSTGSVLDIGVGQGREAKSLINLGYDYTGVEPAEGLIKKLQQKFPNQKFIANSVYDWHLVPNLFDGFWCSAMLLHVPKENINLVLRQIKKAMKSGAIGFISLAEGSGEYLDNDTGRYFYLYSQDEFANILKQSGFTIEKQAILKQDTHRKWLQTWLTFFVRVN